MATRRNRPLKLAKMKFWDRIQAMAIEMGGHKAGNDFAMAVDLAVEPVEGRLRYIEELVKKGFKEDEHSGQVG